MRTFRIAGGLALLTTLVHCGIRSDQADESVGQSQEALCSAGWSASFSQGGGANEWWAEFKIAGGTVQSAYLEVPGRANVVLSLRDTKWSSSLATKIPRGTQVVLHAVNAAGASAQSVAFAYLDTPTPATDPCSAGSDAGSSDAGSGTSCGWSPTITQGVGANEWWVEYAIAGGSTKSASLRVEGGITVALTYSQSKWRGSPSARIPSGATVTLHAEDTSGRAVDTASFRYLVDTAPKLAPCGGTDAGVPPDSGSGTDAGGGSGDPYDPNGVLTYEFTFDADAMAILSSTKEEDQDTWVHGTFKQGNDVVTDVGFRRKGSSTFRALPKKAAFKVRFNKFVKGQKWKGFTDLTLNNSTSDPTFIAERLAYHVYRAANLPAQRAASAQVRINGENYGLYANIETPNKQLNERLFPTNANTLYEINWGSQWRPGLEGGFEEEVGDGSYADVHALFNAVSAANDATLLDDVSGVLDTTEWLKYSAMEGVIGNFDGYAFGKWGSHNYFMAGNTTGHFTLIPWSTDGTMSDRQGLVDASMPQNTAGEATLLVRCKRSTACWSAYKDQMRAMLTVFESQNIADLARTWHAQVDPLVVADPKREASLDYYHSESTKLYDWLTGRPAKVRAQLGL